MSQTQQTFIMFIIVLRQHVSIFIESPSGPSQNTDPYRMCQRLHSQHPRTTNCTTAIHLAK